MMQAGSLEGLLKVATDREQGRQALEKLFYPTQPLVIPVD